MNKLFKNWIMFGWASIGISILFWIVVLLRFINGVKLESYLYPAIIFLIIGLIQLKLKSNLK
jgi:hypothetical protein